MWKGMFSPNLQKAIDPSDVRFEADDGRTEADLSDDDAEVTGSIFVTLPTSGGTTEYEWPNMEYGEYLDWENDDFSGRWMNDNLSIDYTVGGWGWAHGRTIVTGTHDWGWGEGRGK